MIHCRHFLCQIMAKTSKNWSKNDGILRVPIGEGVEELVRMGVGG